VFRVFRAFLVFVLKIFSFLKITTWVIPKRLKDKTKHGVDFGPDSGSMGSEMTQIRKSNYFTPDIIHSPYK